MLPDSSVVSPEEHRSFAPHCPDLVVELASLSHEGPRGSSALRRKMVDDQRNGARLGWLLSPGERAVELWLANGSPQRLERIEVLEATLECPGMQLQWAEIWAG